nr:variable surface lipoprotein [Mycoplasmopsis bovis]
MKRCWNWNCYWSTRRIFNWLSVENPIHKNRKGKIKASGFVNVEKEGDKLKIKFRFFKYNKGASPTVSTKVYEAIIS